MSNDRVGDAAEFTTHLTRLCELDHIGYDRWGAVTSGSKGPFRVINGPLWMGGRSAVKLCVNRPKNSCRVPGDYARSNSSDKISTTRNVEGGGGAAVAKRAGLQASRT